MRWASLFRGMAVSFHFTHCLGSFGGYGLVFGNVLLAILLGIPLTVLPKSTSGHLVPEFSDVMLNQVVRFAMGE